MYAKMLKANVLLLFSCLYVYKLAIAENKQEVNIETREDDPLITKMFAKEIEEGDNSELPLKSIHKHHKGKKKHLHGAYHGVYHEPLHGVFNGAYHHNHHVPIGLPIDEGFNHHGPGFPHYDLHHIGGGHGGHISHHLPIGHAPELPIIHLDNHHNLMHHGHFAQYPEYMPLPYALPMCVIGMLL